MFTGIIEEVGTIKSMRKGPRSLRLELAAQKTLEETKIGDSIAVDGVCLTVTDLGKDAFFADVMEETVKKSTLSSLKTGAKVNLERALRADSRLGGHFVSGHVDGLGTIVEKKRADIAHLVRIRLEKDLMRYVAAKGSIAVDGISLTVAAVAGDTFTVSVIPHTEKETTLITKGKNDKVNIECDVIAKYVESLRKAEDGSAKIDRAFLERHGFYH